MKKFRCNDGFEKFKISDNESFKHEIAMKSSTCSKVHNFQVRGDLIESEIQSGLGSSGIGDFLDYIKISFTPDPGSRCPNLVIRCTE